MRKKSIEILIKIIYDLEINCAKIRETESKKILPNYNEYYKMISLLEHNICQYVICDENNQQVRQNIMNWVIEEEKIIQPLIKYWININTKVYRSLNLVFSELLNIENHLE